MAAPILPSANCEIRAVRSGGIDQRVPKLSHFPSVVASPGTVRVVAHYDLRPAHWFGLQWIARIIV